jgi:hypothetical protein
MIRTEPSPMIAPPLPKKHVSILISFVDDFVTECAFIGQVFLKRLSTGNRVFRIPGKMKHWSRGKGLPYVRWTEDKRETAVAAMVGTIEKYFQKNPNHVLKRLEITGHGHPAVWAGRLSLEDVADGKNCKRLLLERIKPYWCESNDGFIMRMCCCAQYEEGQGFLRELSKAIGAKVTGWTGVYEIHPTGEEWTATPEGKVFKSGDTGRTSHFAGWQELSGLKKALGFPGFVGRMAWRTISGR